MQQETPDSQFLDMLGSCQTVMTECKKKVSAAACQTPTGASSRVSVSPGWEPGSAVNQQDQLNTEQSIPTYSAECI